MIFIFSNQFVFSDWLDNAVNNYTATSPGYYKNQQRGFITGGGFSTRIKNKKEYLVNIQMPKIKSGCGGIDTFLGGISFMDAEYLKKKLEGALQAAPTVAFDMALKTACKECSDTIKSLSSMADRINSIQVSECGLAKKGVAILKGDSPDITGGVLGDLNKIWADRKSKTKNSYATTKAVAVNKGKPIVDLKPSLDGCPAEIKNTFAKNNTTVLENIANKYGLGSSYVGVIRGFVGDITIKKGANGVFGGGLLIPCSQNDIRQEIDIMQSNIFKQSKTGVCTKSNGLNLINHVGTLLTSIANKIKTDSSGFTANEIKFINMMPAPVYVHLEAASIRNDTDLTISILKEPLARLYALAIISDLTRTITHLINVADGITTTANPVGNQSAETCSLASLTSVVAKVPYLKKEASSLLVASQKARTRALVEYNTLRTFSEAGSKENKKTIRDKASLK